MIKKQEKKTISKSNITIYCFLLDQYDELYFYSASSPKQQQHFLKKMKFINKIFIDDYRSIIVR